MNHTESVGLVVVARNLCQQLAVRHSCRCREMQFVANRRLYFHGDVLCQRYAGLVPGDIKERLINGERLYKVGVAAEYPVYLPRHLSVTLHARGHDDELRAEAFSHCHGQGGAYTVPARLIARRGNHSTLGIMPHCHGSAGKFGMVEQFHGCKEAVHIHMYYLTVFTHRFCRCCVVATHGKVTVFRANTHSARQAIKSKKVKK